MRFRAWREERETRALITGDGMVVANKGDLVIVAIVEKWDDADKAIAALAALTGRGATEEP